VPPEDAAQPTTRQATLRPQLVRAMRIAVRILGTFLGGLTLIWLLSISIRRGFHRPLPPWAVPVLLSVSVAAAIGVGVYAYRRLGDLQPKPLGPPRRSPIDERIEERAYVYAIKLGGSLGAIMLVLVTTVAFNLLPPGVARGTVVLLGAPALAIACLFIAAGLAETEYREVLARQTARRPMPRDLAKRAAELQRLLLRASYQEEELRQEVEMQQQILKEISERVVDYQRMAAISKPEAESVARVMDALEEPHRRRSSRTALIYNVGFFIAGVVAPLVLHYGFGIG
jgi:hypothetical protein